MSGLNDLDAYDDVTEPVDEESEVSGLLATPGTFEVLSLRNLDIDNPEDRHELKSEVVMALRRLMVDRDISAKVRHDSAVEIAHMLDLYPKEVSKGGTNFQVNVGAEFSRTQNEQIGQGLGILRTSLEDAEVIEYSEEEDA